MTDPNGLRENAWPVHDRVIVIEDHCIDATTAWDIRPALLRALYGEGPGLSLDLGAVRFIDSSGLGMLIGLLKEARAMDGDLRLVNPSLEVRHILRVTGLDGVFTVDAPREDAAVSPCGYEVDEAGASEGTAPGLGRLKTPR